MNIKKLFFVSILVFTCFSCKSSIAQDSNQKKNILLIFVDDMRPEINAFGIEKAVTPNLDKIADNGTIFTNAYCNIPVCGASRASIMSGIRPGMHRFQTFLSNVERDVPNAVTIPETFKNSGYATISYGKVFHDPDDQKEQWDELWRSDLPLWTNSESLEKFERLGKGPITEISEKGDDAYPDGEVANKAISKLKTLKNSDKPFFMSVGFLRPHLPFCAPKKYWDLYPEGYVKPAENNFIPKNAPKRSIHNSGELRQYTDIPDGVVQDSMAYQLVRGYYAALSYSDALIGKVMGELKAQGLDKNTTVIVIGDHGWNLREHTLWAKHANYRTSLRTPLLVSGPNVLKGQKLDGLVEFVDLYPTICDIAGLEAPKQQLEGVSFKEALYKPNVKLKDFVISQFKTGVTITTQQEAYTEYLNNDLSVADAMYYDRSNDIDENESLYGNPDYQDKIDNVSKIMHDNWGKYFDVKSDELGKILKEINNR